MNPARRSTLSLAALLTALLLGLGLLAPAQAATYPSYSFSSSGDTVTLKKGTLLQVKLAENPSTGYGWRITQGIAPYGKVVANTFVSDKSVDPPVPGNGGTHVYTIKGLRVGTNTFKAALYAPGAKTASVHFRLTIKVVS